MIDCENEVFTKVATALREEFSDIDIASEYVQSPSTFPHVSITQTDSYAVDGMQDSSLRENLTEVTFETDVYSNKTEGKKTECKTILQLIDNTFYSMNFRRIAMTPVPNMEDATIYRITARYRARTDGTHFYRR